MLLELAKPLSFLLCLYSLLTVFHRVFFTPGGSLLENGSDALLLLLFAGGIAVVSGVLFAEADRGRGSAGTRAEGGHTGRRWDPNLHPGLYRGMRIVSRSKPVLNRSSSASLRFDGVYKTLPVQVFLWATGLMAGLFVAAWYVETYILPFQRGRF